MSTPVSSLPPSIPLLTPTPGSPVPRNLISLTLSYLSPGEDTYFAKFNNREYVNIINSNRLEVLNRTTDEIVIWYRNSSSIFSTPSIASKLTAHQDQLGKLEHRVKSWSAAAGTDISTIKTKLNKFFQYLFELVCQLSLEEINTFPDSKFKNLMIDFRNYKNNSSEDNLTTLLSGWMDNPDLEWLDPLLAFSFEEPEIVSGTLIKILKIEMERVQNLTPTHTPEYRCQRKITFYRVAPISAKIRKIFEDERYRKTFLDPSVSNLASRLKLAYVESSIFFESFPDGLHSIATNIHDQNLQKSAVTAIFNYYVERNNLTLAESLSTEIDRSLGLGRNLAQFLMKELSNVYLRRNDVEKATKLATLVLCYNALAPEVREAYTNIFNYYFDNGDYRNSEKLVFKISNSNLQFDLLNILFDSCLKKGNFGQAIRLAGRLLRNTDLYHYNQAMINIIKSLIDHGGWALAEGIVSTYPLDIRDRRQLAVFEALPADLNAARVACVNRRSARNLQGSGKVVSLVPDRALPPQAIPIPPTQPTQPPQVSNSVNTTVEAPQATPNPSSQPVASSTSSPAPQTVPQASPQLPSIETTSTGDALLTSNPVLPPQEGSTPTSPEIQMPPNTIQAPQTPPETTRGTQLPSDTILPPQTPPETMQAPQTPPEITQRPQPLSEPIQPPQMPPETTQSLPAQGTQSGNPIQQPTSHSEVPSLAPPSPAITNITAKLVSNKIPLYRRIAIQISNFVISFFKLLFRFRSV